MNERYINTRGLTLFQAIHKIARIQLKGKVADFGSAFGISGRQPSIRIVEL